MKSPFNFQMSIGSQQPRGLMSTAPRIASGNVHPHKDRTLVMADVPDRPEPMMRTTSLLAIGSSFCGYMIACVWLYLGSHCRAELVADFSLQVYTNNLDCTRT